MQPIREASDERLETLNQPAVERAQTAPSEDDTGSVLHDVQTQTPSTQAQAPSHLGAATHRPLQRGRNSTRTARSRQDSYISGGPPSRIENSQSRPRGEIVDWVDEDYFDQNPWYGQAGKKPVFSLGKPLPRTVRRQPTRTGSRAQDDLAEAGQLGEEETTRPRPIRRQAYVGRGPRRTVAGTAHGDRLNDAGQPVFEYIPENNGSGEEEVKSPDGDQSDESPDFKIDSEPLGKREHGDGEKDPDELRNRWARFRAKHPEPLAEFLATGVAIFLGLSGSLSVNISASQSTQYGTYETSCWAWGFSWMLGVYIGGGISGSHLNPCISISLSVFRGFPWRQCMVYVAAQFLAGLVAAAVAYGAYSDTIRALDPTMEATATTFFSTPQAWVSPGVGFLNQCAGSAVMMIAVFALGDDQNNPPGAGMHAFVLGLLFTTLKFTLGYNTGSAFNPASDFGPRLIVYAFGYRDAHIFLDGWWFYGPWVGTLVGSLIGCAIYDSFIFVGSESPINYRFPHVFEKYRSKPKSHT